MTPVIRSLLSAFSVDTHGSVAIEYSVLAGVVAVTVIAAMTNVGQVVKGTLLNLASSF